MPRRPPGASRTYILFPHTPLFLSVAGDGHDRLLERLDVSAQRFAVIDEIAALRVDQQAQLPGLRIAALAAGTRQFELEHRARVERGGDHEEDDQAQDHVDHRDQVDLRVVLGAARSEEHTSELQSLMRISYAVFCLKKKKQP